MDFGQALKELKQGKKVSRSGWNGKGMWLLYVPSQEIEKLKEGSVYQKAGLLGCVINAHIDMMTATGEMQPGWLASQTDMLADDWGVVE